MALTRRELAALSLSVLMPVRSAFAENIRQKATSRLIALDWGVAETLIGLGHPPLGAAEIQNYNRTVVAPAMPAAVVDIGLRLAPNPELMQSLRPDLVLINPAQKYMIPSLTAFGDVEIIAIYTDENDPYRLSCEAANNLAFRMGDPTAAVRLNALAETTMSEIRARLHNYDGRPIYAINFLDGRRLDVVGTTSLFQGVFERLGLRNACRRPSNNWGIASLEVQDLADEPEARVFYFGPLSEEAKRTISRSPLWLRLPFVRAERVMALPPIWTFGALPSAIRFARMLGDALAPSDMSNG